VASGGSIDSRRYVPAFTTTDRTHSDLTRALARLGLDTEPRHAADAGRATEYVPTSDGSVFGRVHTVMGAPVGAKSERQSPSLPAYLDHQDCPHHIRLDFARVVVRNRGTPRLDRPSTPVQISEERTSDYRQSLRQLFAAVVGDGDTIRGSESSDVTLLTERAAGVLCAPPTFGTYLD